MNLRVEWWFVLLLVVGCAESRVPSPSSNSMDNSAQMHSSSQAVVPVNNEVSDRPEAVKTETKVETKTITQTSTATEVSTPSPSPTPDRKASDEPDLNDPNWKKVSEDDGINTYQKKLSSQDVVTFRGETLIPSPLKKIATVLSDADIRKEWVDALLETRTIATISDFERIEYNHTKVPWPFQDRDFVYRVQVKVDRDAGAMLIDMGSIEDSREPPHDHIVRGEILHSSYWMKEIPGATPSTHVVIEMAIDPKGAIPMWMVNLTQKKWPHNTLLALKKLSERPDLVVPKTIEDYFSVSTKPLGKKGKKK